MSSKYMQERWERSRERRPFQDRTAHDLLASTLERLISTPRIIERSERALARTRPGHDVAAGVDRRWRAVIASVATLHPELVAAARAFVATLDQEAPR